MNREQAKTAVFAMHKIFGFNGKEAQENCQYCHPYQEHIIEGENGFYCVTKNAELIAFNHADEVEAVKAKINYCPICGRKLESQS